MTPSDAEPAIAIRAATPADAQRVSELLDVLGYPADRAEVATRLERWEREPEAHVLVAEIGAAVAGLVAVAVLPQLQRAGRLGRIMALAVAPAFEGRGIGRQLVAAAHDAAAAMGCAEMEVTSARYRERAHRLYRGLGYEDVCHRSARFRRPLGQPPYS